MRRSGGPHAASNRSPRPSSCKRLIAEAAMNSPQTLRLGKRAFSSTATERPARARRSAAVAPAGPPPTTRTSKRCISAGDEAMAERAGGVLIEPLALGARRELGQLASAKAGAYARLRIVARQGVAAEHPGEPARSERRAGAARLAGDEKPRPARDQPEELAQRRALEVVQKEVGHDRAEGLAARGKEVVRARGHALFACGLRKAQPVEKDHFRTGHGDAPGECAVARAEVEKGMRAGAELAPHMSGVAHERVQAAQVAA